jgi:vacuolar-type H+-ATPase subunit F/Vma7
MGPVVLIGDELHAAAFRLAGVDTRQPAPAELAATFEQARRSAALILLTRDCATALPAAQLQQALRREAPLVLVLPDLAAPAADAELARRMHAVLGIEA